MPNKNKKKHYNRNNQNNQNFHMNSNGGVRKGNNSYKHNRKNYINPSVISSFSDDEASIRSNSYNENIYNGFSNRSSSERKGNKKSRARLEGLKSLGRQKTMGIGDDDKEASKPLLPSTPHSQISNMPPDVFSLIVTYVQNYFNCFDTNREGLLGAYNKQCTFSLSLNMSNTVAYRQFKFDEYMIKENRNLKRIVGNDDRNIEKRFRLQHNGYIDTLAQLCKLPATEHDPRSFKLDVDFFTPNMIKFSLSGVYKEGKSTDKVRPFRSFHRVFVCIPDTVSQMTIINEQYTISHLTNDQYKQYYSVAPEQQVESQMNSSDPLPQTNTVQPPNDQQTSADQDLASKFPDLTEQKRLMLVEFSKQSRLNHEWSKYCLEHVNWNFDDGAKAFIQFKDSIPKDAYII